MNIATPADVPVAEDWFVRTAINETVTLIYQPYIDAFLQANIWHVRGKDYDVLVDSGLGVVPLMQQVLRWFGREPILILTHAHLDHMGSAYEFSECWAHPSEPVSNPGATSLNGDDCMRLFGVAGSKLGSQTPGLMLTRLPYPSYEPAQYRLHASRVTKFLQEGDEVDLGDRVFNVLHMPGHSPGSICLYDPDNKELFSGDVIYDGELVDYVSGSDIADYVMTMERLKNLPVACVYPGHGEIFSKLRMNEIAEDYMKANQR